MEIKDRISNIKKLLPFCTRWSNECEIIDEECGLFFTKFFSSDSKFKKPPFEHTYVRIRLATVLNYGEDDHTISLGYCSNCTRDDEEWVIYYFDDPDIEFTEFMAPKDNMKYSDIPDNIWERIQNILYEKSVKSIEKEIQSAKTHLESELKNKEKFDSIVLIK